MRVTEKGQVTIPKPIRDRLGIGPGSEVDFVLDEAGVRLVGARSRLNNAHIASFDDWAERVRGVLDTQSMDGKAYVDWVRGLRDGIDAD